MYSANTQEEEEGMMELGNSDEEPTSKRARMDSSADEFSTGDPPNVGEEGNASSTVNPQLLEHAKIRLSKWAARLFDPDRPRGLVQAPETIPLNDEHLKAFGERVKKERTDLKIDVKIEDTDDELYEGIPTPGTGIGKKRKSKVGTKVKVTNLDYTIDTTLLQVACEKYGPLLDVNLIMSKEDPSLNSGRAYVTFELEDDALDCIENMKELGGRPLRLGLAAEKSRAAAAAAATPTAMAAPQSMLNRSFDKDISTICYRCGEVGHYEANCPNQAKPKPCALCGSLEHQDRRCDHKMICFNCGCVGHAARDCPERRGLPPRMLCSICFESGHHRNSCRNFRGSGANGHRDAICMQCGQSGHFLCKPLQWFFGLKGIFCFQCGSEGHSGFQCQRPHVFVCRDEPLLGAKEIERAEANSIAEQLQNERRQQESRGRQLGRSDGGGGPRHRSMPPTASRAAPYASSRAMPPQNRERRGYR